MKQLLVKQTEHIDEDFILKKCNNLLKEAEIKKAPIDPKILASFCDIKMVNEKKMNEAGMLIPLKQGGAKILLRLSDNSRRKRFTCCHEIVHTFFPDYQLNPQKRVDEETGIYDNKNNTEYLCDLGASELLIPSFLFNPKFETMGFSMGTLQRLADDFDSSLEATAIKMVKTDLDNKAMIVWEEQFKPKQYPEINTLNLPGFEKYKTQKKLRIKFGYGFNNFNYLPKFKSLEEDKDIILKSYNHDIALEGKEKINFGNFSINCLVYSLPILTMGSKKIITLLEK